jgi:hypothetical protein
MTTNLSNGIPAETLRRWMLRAMVLGLFVGVAAGVAALLS